MAYFEEGRLQTQTEFRIFLLMYQGYTLSATAFVLGTEKVGQSPSQNIDYVSNITNMRIDKVSANGATFEPRCRKKF